MGKEGFFQDKLVGPGKVILQTRTRADIAKAVRKMVIPTVTKLIKDSVGLVN